MRRYDKRNATEQVQHCAGPVLAPYVRISKTTQQAARVRRMLRASTVYGPQMLQLLADGQSTRAIADEFKIHLRGVERVLHEYCGLINAVNYYHAIKKALKKGDIQ